MRKTRGSACAGGLPAFVSCQKDPMEATLIRMLGTATDEAVAIAAPSRPSSGSIMRGHKGRVMPHFSCWCAGPMGGELPGWTCAWD